MESEKEKEVERCKASEQSEGTPPVTNNQELSQKPTRIIVEPSESHQSQPEDDETTVSDHEHGLESNSVEMEVDSSKPESKEIKKAQVQTCTQGDKSSSQINSTLSKSDITTHVENSCDIESNNNDSSRTDKKENCRASPDLTLRLWNYEEPKKQQIIKLQGSSYACRICKKTFPSPQALGGHVSSHTKAKNQQGDEPEPKRIKISKTNNNNGHKCKQCGCVFETGQSLGGHMGIHKHLKSKKSDSTANEQLPSKEPEIVTENSDKGVNGLPFMQSGSSNEVTSVVIRESATRSSIVFGFDLLSCQKL